LTTAHDLAHHQAICRMLLVKFFEKKASPSPARLLTGHDLIRELGLTPGPRFAKILEQVAEAQHLGKVQTKAEALSLAGKIA
jgi:poly(A) polymerase